VTRPEQRTNGLAGFVSGPLPEFRPVFKCWLQLHQRYIKSWRYADVPRVYGERSSLSLLAAAAWQCGGIALEEFSAAKKPRATNADIPVKTDSYGRCDLFISVKGRDFLMEAKRCWPSLDGDVTTRVSKALLKATKDVRRNDTYVGAHRLGVVLIGPHSRRDSGADIDFAIGEFVQSLAQMKGCASAWFFPPSTRSFAVTDDKRLYPGAAVVVKPLRRRSPSVNLPFAIPVAY
jgi:hypothetical protein